VNMVDNLFIRHGNFIEPHSKVCIRKQLFTVFVRLTGTSIDKDAFITL